MKQLPPFVVALCLLVFSAFVPGTAAASVLDVSGGGTGLSSVPEGNCLSGSADPLQLSYLPCFSASTSYQWLNLQNFQGGFVSFASSTIGNGTQSGGLTVNGGATITKNLVVQSTGTSSFAGALSVGSGLKLGTGYLARFSNIFSHRAYTVCASGILITAGCDYVADGIADNVDIQAAYQAASLLNNGQGGEVWLSAGQFAIAAPIRLERNNVTIRGAGIDATSVFVADNANVSAFSYTGSADIMFNSLQSFTIDGNRANNSSGYGVYIAPSSTNHFWDFYVRDVWTKNMSNDGFYSYDGHGFVLDHFLSEYNDGHGVRFNGIDEPEIQNGTFKFNGGNGITCNNNSCIVQSNEVSDNTGYGIEMSGVSGIASNNVVYQNGLSGIHVTKQPYIKIVNNIVKTNQQHGIFVDTSDSFISGNSVFENSQEAVNAYDEINVAHMRANVSNNTIDGASQSRYGINFDASWGIQNSATNNTIINEVTALTNDDSQGTTWFNGGSDKTVINETVVLNAASNSNIGNYLCIDPTTKKIVSGTTCTLSSSRFKDNITPFAGSGLDEVMALKPVTFTFKDGYGDNGNTTQIGFVAEDAVSVDPRLVPLDESGAPSGFLYQNYTAVLTKAIQELAQRVASIDPSALSVVDPFTAYSTRLAQWFADSTNAIGDLFANRMHATEICLHDDGGETCITRAQLDALLTNTPAIATTGATPAVGDTQNSVPPDATQTIVPQDATQSIVPQDATETMVTPDAAQDVVPADPTQTIVPQDATQKTASTTTSASE